VAEQQFDVVVVGGGSAGAVIAARLSEDPSVRVALVEAGGPPPLEESMPAAVASLQLNPETDWMYTGDAGGVGRGLAEGRMMVPRGKMLGGSSGINYMAYVRGHPGDFDSWADGGARGWAHDDVLPYFKKSEGIQPSGDIVVDHGAHNPDGPLGVSVRSPVIPAAQQFVDAAVAAGIPRGDYNGSDRARPEGVASLFQTTTKDGKRSSTFHGGGLSSDRWWAQLLDEDTYLCSVSSMYRILGEHRQVKERRRLARHPARVRPELVATGPGQVYSWTSPSSPARSRAPTSTRT